MAGQRVQIIKRDAVRVGYLEFGTEIIAGKDNMLVTLPGASTATFIAREAPKKCLVERLTEDGGLQKLRQIIRNWNVDLIRDAGACRHTRAITAPVLGLHNV